MAGKDRSPEILDAVRHTLGQYRRPRKNPGEIRPVAVLKNGQVVEKVTSRHIPEIQRLSLPGAFRYVEITGKFSKIPSEKAKRAFYEAHTGKNGFETGILDQEIIEIDQNTYDSREIVRNLRAAAKKLRKAGSRS